MTLALAQLRSAPAPAPVYDLHPKATDFEEDVLAGLTRQPKRLSSMYFYDQRGSQLFDRICELEEYYPTRTEVGILERSRDEIARAIGPQASLIELGSGSSSKTHILLGALPHLHSYVPVDISKSHLAAAASRVAEQFPHLHVQPVCADFMEPLKLPTFANPPREKFVFFPGSTVGNFHHEQRRKLLQSVAALCRPQGGGFIVGIDLKKNKARLESAYNDAAGVTADFNLNVLRRINQELGAHFDLKTFEHKAVYNEQEGRIEMHLVSQCSQVVRVCGAEVAFAEGESICTEYSYKFSVDEFTDLAVEVGMELSQVWLDSAKLFAVLLFRVPRLD